MTQYDLEHANLYADGPTATNYRGRNPEAALYAPTDFGAADDKPESAKVAQIAAQSPE